MNVKQFVQQHREDWKKLEKLIHTLHKKRRTFTGAQIDLFYRLYQKTAQNLSYSQTYFPNEEVTLYLNELVSKSHNLLYKDQISSMKQVQHFFTVTFIRLLSEQWKAVTIAMLLFILGALGSFFAVWSDPHVLYSIVSPEIAQGVDPDSLGTFDGEVDSFFMSAEIMTNNIQVAILAFAGGITFGLLTVYVLIYNGILIGALAALFGMRTKHMSFGHTLFPMV